MEKNQTLTTADKVAKCISNVLQPIFLPFYALLYWWYVHPDTLPIGTAYTWAAVYITFSCFIPAFAHLVLYFTGKVGDFFISNRNKRLPINLISLISLIAGQLILQQMHAWPIDRVMFGSVIAVGVITVITLFWKVSAHVASISCIITSIFCFQFIVGDYSVWLQVVMLVLAGAVGWSRIQLKAHTLAQVLVGVLVGVLSMIIAFSVYQNATDVIPYIQ